MHMMPPGAANLPIRIIVVPDKDLQKAADDADAQRALQEKIRKEAELAAKAQEAQKETDSSNMQTSSQTVSAPPTDTKDNKKEKKKQKESAKKKSERRVYTPTIYGN